jgi:polyphosphate kinase
MMHRNLDRRVETLVRVETPALRERLRNVLQLSFADNQDAWELGPEGEWTPISASGGEPATALQTEMMRYANRTGT